MVSYNLQQISTIQSNGFEYKLPDDVLSIINKLSDEIELISPSITITTSTTTINDNLENSLDILIVIIKKGQDSIRWIKKFNVNFHRIMLIRYQI